MSSAETQALLADRMAGIFTPLEISSEQFRKAYDTSEIGPHIEKDYKGLSYLSWPFAYRYLKEHFPALYVAFEEKTMGEVVFGGPGAYYLRPYLTDGIKRTVALVFPIMDRKHNAIKELDGRAISDNCQRAAVNNHVPCLVHCQSRLLHFVGLPLYLERHGGDPFAPSWVKIIIAIAVIVVILIILAESSGVGDIDTNIWIGILTIIITFQALYSKLFFQSPHLHQRLLQMFEFFHCIAVLIHLIFITI